MINENFKKYFMLGLEYKKNIEYKKAETAYLKALEYEPDSTETLFNLASIYLLLNKPHRAIEYYNKCLKINPDDFEAEYFLSLAYFRVKDYENGENTLKKDSVEKQPLKLNKKHTLTL